MYNIQHTTEGLVFVCLTLIGCDCVLLLRSANDSIITTKNILCYNRERHTLTVLGGITCISYL